MTAVCVGGGVNPSVCACLPLLRLCIYSPKEDRFRLEAEESRLHIDLLRA